MWHCRIFRKQTKFGPIWMIGEAFFDGIQPDEDAWGWSAEPETLESDQGAEDLIGYIEMILKDIKADGAVYDHETGEIIE